MICSYEGKCVWQSLDEKRCLCKTQCIKGDYKKQQQQETQPLEFWLNKIHCGDCIEVMKGISPNVIDCIVTDIPYGISFMGKDWDKALPDKEAFRQMFRVLKAGGLAFVMSSPRQDVLWRVLKMLEDCGFILKQSFISWIYKTGFPKAYDVSKGIDKKLHASDLAKKWSGWKSITGLKPALECILMVNKPFSEKTIVDNVLKHGTGAINVNACRIPFQREDVPKEMVGQGYASIMKENVKQGFRPKDYYVEQDGFKYKPSNQGRFPANLLVTEQALKCYKYFDLDKWAEHRGFLDVSKASKRERDEGIESLPIREVKTHGKVNPDLTGKSHNTTGQRPAKRRNFHPTVKPVKLMAYLIELGCQPDGIVLDPFVGSGTTCIAAKRLNRKWIGIEISKEYCEIASARLENAEIVMHKTADAYCILKGY